MLVCEDMWHPACVYVAALDRALMLLCPSSSPMRGFDDDSDRDSNARVVERMTEVYAHTYSLFLVYANRVGFEDGIGFWGGSEIIDPAGQRLVKAKHYEEDLVAASVNMKAARRQRVTSPVLRDEDVDLTINELLRIRERSRNKDGAGTPARTRTAKKPARKRHVSRKKSEGR